MNTVVTATTTSIQQCYHQCISCGISYECERRWCARPFSCGKCSICNSVGLTSTLMKICVEALNS